jgi:phosphoribosylaminoimidazole-succinocarboxamide synthase
METISYPDFKFDGQTNHYRGKVRDVYSVGNDLLVMVASDRISAFDHILPKPIPRKGQVLNQLAAYFLESTGKEVPNWWIASPDPQVSIGWNCEPFRVEMVVRGYLAGHAWRTYQSGERVLCGVKMPEGMKENDPFFHPIITPSTKAMEGHDEDITKEEIIERELVSKEDYSQLENYALTLFKLGSAMAHQKGLILVDTKYEFGKRNGKIMLIDEIHTPDSSRYFHFENYAKKQLAGEKQVQLSKEFVREWLMENNFQGKENQTMPVMPEEFVELTTQKYVDLFEKITGKKLDSVTAGDSKLRIENTVNEWLKNFKK